MIIISITITHILYIDLLYIYILRNSFVNIWSEAVFFLAIPVLKFSE